MGLSQCQLKDPKPEEHLPPATQTGANTFGCLVNGQVWTPAGYNGSSNYSMSYDTGVMDLRTYRYQQQPTNNFQYLILFARNMQRSRSYDLSGIVENRIGWYDRLTGCDLSSDDPDTYHKGTLTITRLDLQAGVITGTFDFILAKPGCDTVRVTQGRFDKRL